MSCLSFLKLSNSKQSRLRHWSLVALTVFMLGLITDGFHTHVDSNEAFDCLVCQQRIDQNDIAFSTVFLSSFYTTAFIASIVKPSLVSGLSRAIPSIRAPPVSSFA